MSNLCFNVNVIIDVLMILVSHKQGGVVLIYHIFFSCLFLTNFCWHQSWTATGKVKSHQFSGVGGLLVHFYWNFIHKMLIFHSQAIVVHMSMYVVYEGEVAVTLNRTQTTRRRWPKQILRNVNCEGAVRRLFVSIHSGASRMWRIQIRSSDVS